MVTPLRWHTQPWNFEKKISPVTCPIWGDVFGSEKFKKSDPQSHFTPKHDFQKSSFCSNSQVDWGDWTRTYLGSEGLFERDFEISKKNLHPAHVPYRGMFLESKNPKNRTPKVVFHPNTILKSHHFVVIILIHLYIHSSRQTIGPRDTIYVTYY